MKTISLSINTIRVKRAFSREFELLDEFSGEAEDLYDVLYSTIGTCTSRERMSEESSQALQVTKLHRRNREIEGLIHAGYFGSESQIRRLGQWDSVRYEKSTDDVDLLPYYFLFDLPQGREQGYMLLQGSGQDSIQTLFRKILHELFSTSYPDHRIEFKPLVPDELLKQLKSEEAKGSEIRFIRHTAPRDIASLIGRRGTDTSTGSIELVMKFHEDGFAVRALERALTRPKQDGILELEDVSFAYDNVKIKVNLGGKSRTVDLGQPGRMRPTMDITEQVKFRAGHPTFDSVSNAAHELLSSLKQRLERNAPG